MAPHIPQAVCGLPGGPFPLNRFARETWANRYAPLGARRRSGVGLLPQAVCGLPGDPFSLNRFARETRANRYAPLGARRRSGVGLLPQAVCGLPGGPFPLNRFARETRANRYAPLGARRRSGVGPVWRGDCKSRTSVGLFPCWFFLLIYRGLLAPFVRLRWRCCPTWPSALADMASRMVRTPRR